MKRFDLYDATKNVLAELKNNANFFGKADEVVDNSIGIYALYECKNTNPNGDPSYNGRPRMYTDMNMKSYACVTGISLKAKVRATLQNCNDETNGAFIDGSCYIQNNMIKSDANKEFLKENKFTKDTPPIEIRKQACKKWYDNRLFGATSLANGCSITICGAVNVPDSFSVWEDKPIFVKGTSRGSTNDKNESSDSDSKKKSNNNFTDKEMLKYNLFPFDITIHGGQIKEHGITNKDLRGIVYSLLTVGEHHSVARPHFVCRKLVIFKHSLPHAVLNRNVQKNFGDTISEYNDDMVKVVNVDELEVYEFFS